MIALKRFFCFLFVLVVFLPADAKPSRMSWDQCKDFLSRKLTAGFFNITKKARGYPLLHNLKTFYGMDLYFSKNWRPTTWGSNEDLIGDTGRLFVWSAFQTVSLIEGRVDRFDIRYVKDFKGRLIGVSQVDGTIDFEDAKGGVIRMALPKPQGGNYNLREQLQTLASHNVGWDGDIVGLTDLVGFIITFIPDGER